MIVLTATEASRSFAEVLDRAEQGEAVVVTRGGKRVAIIGPAGVSNGEQVRSLLLSTTVDGRFEDDVRSTRAVMTREALGWAGD